MAFLVVPLAAGAAIDGPCSGTATIDGVTYTEANDSRANPIVVPDEPNLTADWTGRTTNPITDHVGEIGVVIGPATVVIADWSGENSDLETESAGRYSIDGAKDLMKVDLVGLYEVSGFHRGAGGSCDGSVMVKLEGNPLTTPVGGGAAAGTVLAALGTLAAGRRRAA
jgi:hypothetical protein